VSFFKYYPDKRQNYSAHIIAQKLDWIPNLHRQNIERYGTGKFEKMLQIKETIKIYILQTNDRLNQIFSDSVKAVVNR